MTLNLAKTIKPFISTASRRIVVAYSGGRDSHVLLHAIAALRQTAGFSLPIVAIHINHRLHPDADAWVVHCRQVCAALSLPFITETVLSRPKTGESIESFARKARYQLIATHLKAGDIFVSAHHQRDQAETFLLQLMRGAGLDGLCAMPLVRPFSMATIGGNLSQMQHDEGQQTQAIYLRPLLDTAYEAIEQYAKQHQLTYITDTSNADLRFNRNYIRHCVLPDLTVRFPHAVESICRSVQWLQELDGEAPPSQLRISYLASLSSIKRKQAIRAAIKQKTGYALSQNQTDYLMTHFFSAAKDKHPTLTVGPYLIRRFNDEMVVTLPMPVDATGFPAQKITVGMPFFTPVGAIQWQAGEGGLSPNQPLRVDKLHFSDKFRPHNRRHHQPIKKLLAQAQIPPWIRPFIPGLYDNKTLVAIPSLGVHDDFFSQSKDAVLPSWQVDEKFVKL